MSLEEKVQNLIVDEDKIKNYFFRRDSDEYRKIKSPDTFIESTIGYFSGEIQSGAYLPFDKAENFRLRLGETTIWSGYSGHGKSMLLSYVTLKLLENYKVMICSFEMSCRSTLARYIRQSVGTSEPTEDAITKFCTDSTGKLFLYDQLGSTNPIAVLSVIYYSAEHLGCQHFVVDSLMKCSINEDDYNGQKKFVDQLCIAARDLNVHIHLICHSRKTVDEALHKPSKFDVAGSATITSLADNCVSIYRNKKKEKDIMEGKLSEEDARIVPDGFMAVNKQRHFEWEGSVPLWFQPKSLRYRDKPI
jgi:twinkle protein